MKIDGGPAFPSHGSMGEVTHDGMSMRDCFAKAAMQAHLSDSVIFDSVSRVAHTAGIKMPECIATAAYEYADAMLAERAK